MNRKSAAASGARHLRKQSAAPVYTYGTAARELRPVETEERRSHVDERARRQRSQRRLREEQALQMDLPYLLMLTAATIAALFICCSYIRVRSSVSASMRSIEKQEQALEVLKNKNDALQTEINTDVDLDSIYNRAVNELGMVYAGRNQIIRYKKTESEYVRQYEDIPGENAK